MRSNPRTCRGPAGLQPDVSRRRSRESVRDSESALTQSGKHPSASTEKDLRSEMSPGVDILFAVHQAGKAWGVVVPCSSLLLCLFKRGSKMLKPSFSFPLPSIEMNHE